MVTLADGEYSKDKSAAEQSVAGDMLCLLSAVVYGAYTVSIRCEAKGESRGLPYLHATALAAHSLEAAENAGPSTTGALRGGPTLPACAARASLRCPESPLPLLSPGARRKLLREDDDTPMTMFFGFMGLLIFLSVGPLLLILW